MFIFIYVLVLTDIFSICIIGLPEVCFLDKLFYWSPYANEVKKKGISKLAVWEILKC
jgi:hypothetical protein